MATAATRMMRAAGGHDHENQHQGRKHHDPIENAVEQIGATSAEDAAGKPEDAADKDGPQGSKPGDAQQLPAAMQEAAQHVMAFEIRSEHGLRRRRRQGHVDEIDRPVGAEPAAEDTDQDHRQHQGEADAGPRRKGIPVADCELFHHARRVLSLGVARRASTSETMNTQTTATAMMTVKACTT